MTVRWLQSNPNYKPWSYSLSLASHRYFLMIWPKYALRLHSSPSRPSVSWARMVKSWPQSEAIASNFSLCSLFLLPHPQHLQPCPSKPQIWSCLTYACMCAKSLQSYPTLCDPMDCGPPGSSVHGDSPARLLEWVVMPSCRGSSPSRDQTQVSCASCIASLLKYPSIFFTAHRSKPKLLSLAFKALYDLVLAFICSGNKLRTDGMSGLGGTWVKKLTPFPCLYGTTFYLELHREHCTHTRTHTHHTHTHVT